MPTSQRKVGVIGVGFGAQVYVPAFRSEGWDVAAICSRNRDKAVKVAKKAGAPALEAYPLDAKLTPSSSGTGYVTTFLRAGFQLVARHVAPRPIVRYDF